MQLNLADGVHEVRQEYIVPLSRLMTKAFQKNNPIWSKYQMTTAELDQFFQDLFKDHLQSQKRAKKYMKENATINYIYMNKGLVVGTLLHYEIAEYREKIKIKKEPTLAVFQHMQRYGNELMEGIDLDNYEKGKYVYGNFGATDETVIKSKASVLMLLEFCRNLKDSGIKSMIGRASNSKTNQLYQALGGKVLKELQYEENGMHEKVFLISIDLSNEKFLNLCLLHERQKQARAKL